MRAPLVLLLLSACVSEPLVGPQPIATETAIPAYSSADSLLMLLGTPGTFDVLQKHIPYFVNLTEHGIIPAFPTDTTLDDLLNVPEARLTPELLAIINGELAAVKPRE